MVSDIKNGRVFRPSIPKLKRFYFFFDILLLILFYFFFNKGALVFDNRSKCKSIKDAHPEKHYEKITAIIFEY